MEKEKVFYDNCVCCGRPAKGNWYEFLNAELYCDKCRKARARRSKPVIKQTIPQKNWVTTYRKEEEVKKEEAFFPAQLHVAVNPRKVSSKALYGGRTPEEILVYQEEKQQRNFGVSAHKIDPRWAKLLTL